MEASNYRALKISFNIFFAFLVTIFFYFFIDSRLVDDYRVVVLVAALVGLMLELKVAVDDIRAERFDSSFSRRENNYLAVAGVGLGFAVVLPGYIAGILVGFGYR